MRFVQGIAGTDFYNVYFTNETPAEVPPDPTKAVAWNLVYGMMSAVTAKEPGEYYVSVVKRPASSTGGEINVVEPFLMQFNGGDTLTFMINQASASDPTPVVRVINDQP